jgi:hypothetical protein
MSNKVKYPLSLAQKQIYDMEQVADDCNNIAGITVSVMFRGEANYDSLTFALQQIVKRTDIAHLSIRLENGQPYNFFMNPDQSETLIEIKEFVDSQELKCFCSQLAQQPLHDKKMLLMGAVITGQEFGFIVHIHHIIGDAWTVNIFMQAFQDYYYSGLTKQTPSYEIFPYAIYLESEQKYLNSKRFINDKSYWQKTYDNNGQYEYAADGNMGSLASKRIQFTLDAHTDEKIKAYCLNKNISILTLFDTALCAYFCRIRNVSDFNIATAIFSRSNRIERQTPGMFVNTIVLNMHIDFDKSWTENLTAATLIQLDGMKHAKYNYTALANDLINAGNFEGHPYDVYVSYQNRDAIIADINWYHCAAQTESLSVTVNTFKSSRAQFIYDYVNFQKMRFVICIIMFFS